MHGRRLRCVPFALALPLLLAGLLLSRGAVHGSEGALPLPDDPLVGRVLFQSKGCVECHGLAGSGSGIGPDLGEGRFDGTFLDLGASLWNHVPGMSVTFEVAGLPWPDLEAEETTELLAFLYFIDYLGRPGQPDVGEAMFISRGCGACHGTGGAAAGVGPDLTGLETFASPLFVAQQIWNHGPGMMESMRSRGMRAPTFEDGDLADLAAFLRQQASGGPQERLFLAPGNPNSGAALFESKGCRICHGEGGRGGMGGPDLSISDLHRSAEGVAAAMWGHALGMRDAMERRGVGWPTFAGSELADLIAYLYFLPFADVPGDPERGAEVFNARSCASCHGSDGTGPGRIDLEAGLAEMTEGSDAAFLASLWNHAPLMKEEILGRGLPWPELTGEDLRNLLAYLDSGVQAP